MRVLIACEFSGTIRDAFLRAGHDAWSCDLLPSEGKPLSHWFPDLYPPGHQLANFQCHYQCDIRDLFNGPVAHSMGLDNLSLKWDLMIAHPDCTYLTVAGEWAFKDVQTKRMSQGVLYGEARREARREALEFVDFLWNVPVPRIVLENPKGVIPRRRPAMPRPQYIQPYNFGHDASKETGLWLKNVPPLLPTKYINPRWVCCGQILDVDIYFKDGCPNCHGVKRPLPRWANQTNSGQNKLTPSADRWKLRAETYSGIADAMVAQWGNLA